MLRNRIGWIATSLLVGAMPLAAGGPLGFTGKSGNDALRAFDPATGMAVGADIDLLPEGDYPYDATVNPDGTEVWIVGAVGDGVVVIDTETLAVVERIDLAGTAEYPVDVLFGGCGRPAYVASRDSEVVAIINPSTYTVIDTIDMPGVIDAGKMAISPTRNELYVVDWFDDFLVVVDLATQATNDIDIGSSLWDLTISPDESTLFVNDRGTDEVHVVDLDTLMVTDSVPVGDDPWGIDITSDGATVVVANEDSSTVTVIPTATLVPQTVSLPSDSDPRDVVIAEDDGVAFVPSGDIAGDDAIYRVDLATGGQLAPIDVGASNTNVVALAPAGNACDLFEDGFESGDTSAWSATVP